MTWGLDRIDQRVTQLDGKAAFTGKLSYKSGYLLVAHR